MKVPIDVRLRVNSHRNYAMRSTENIKDALYIIGAEMRVWSIQAHKMLDVWEEYLKSKQ